MRFNTSNPEVAQDKQNQPQHRAPPTKGDMRENCGDPSPACPLTGGPAVPTARGSPDQSTHVPGQVPREMTETVRPAEDILHLTFVTSPKSTQLPVLVLLERGEGRMPTRNGGPTAYQGAQVRLGQTPKLHSHSAPHPNSEPASPGCCAGPMPGRLGALGPEWAGLGVWPGGRAQLPGRGAELSGSGRPLHLPTPTQGHPV